MTEMNNRRIKADLVPKTPGGQHFDCQKLDADEIEIDQEITVKSSMFRECKPGNPWFENGGSDDEEPKFVARKSIDLRKFRSNKKRVEAIISSPMVDSRPRRVSYSKSFTEGITNDNQKTPLRLPGYNDLLSSTSRRLSRIILTRRVSMLSSPTGKSPENQPLIPIIPEKENINPLTSLNTSPTREVTILENQPLPPITPPQSPNKDPNSVSEFRVLANMEMTRLISACNDWNGVLSEEEDKIPELALDSIRATVCKCQLLLKNKIPFFQSLIDMAEKHSEQIETDSSVPTTTVNDLLGYWTLVADEITRADEAFERLRLWRDEYNWAPDRRPITPARTQMHRSLPSKIPKRVGAFRAKKTVKIHGLEERSNSKEPCEDVLPQISSALKSPKQAVIKTKPKKSKFAEFLASRRAANANRTPNRKNLVETLTPLGLRPVDVGGDGSVPGL